MIEADHLAVEDSAAHAPERDRDLGGERGKALEGVAVAGDETTLVALHVGERPKSVELQLEQPVAMIEGLAAPLLGKRGEGGEGAGHYFAVPTRAISVQPPMRAPKTNAARPTSPTLTANLASRVASDCNRAAASY